MVFPFFELPALTSWAEQLAGIIPLAALIEFINVEGKLHCTELSTSVCLWNWPVTPKGARLLFSDDETTYAACLDRLEHSSTLHCLDGRYGDWYPSSAPTTVRECIFSTSIEDHIPNEHPNMLDQRSRKQRLEILYVSREPHSNRRPRPRCSWVGIPTQGYSRYHFISISGWILWIFSISISGLARLYIASLYLFMMPLTGLVIRAMYGTRSRELLDRRHTPFERLVIVAESLNSSQWWGFLGESNTVNSLLNKPLYRHAIIPSNVNKSLQMMLAFLIGSQWSLAVGACSIQGWDAYIVASWILLCAVVSSYGYPLRSCVKDWLQHDCGIRIRRIVADFSSRRSLLSAMVYLNPDSKESRTLWINPILAQGEQRNRWERALLDYINTGYVDKEAEKEYWWKFIVEGVSVGKVMRAKFMAEYAKV